MWVIDIVDYLNMDLHHDTPHTLVHIYQTHITVRCLNKDKHSNYRIMKLDHVNQPQANNTLMFVTNGYITYTHLFCL